ncbi:PTS-dependent dihydroxyacetone kinase dihydroxyacetone-binding subunit DhaK [Vibrio halioticoli NBRC 102217]|uniref:PTS-dependent dihydroxyacetone kinase dihydroxyacetone-binding subunit DhaK n=1 Tax=Vibrio halioticoli NBRC 102217 TaxID=1219072 RepID=V5FA97_9VIBR|nr:dihydroxyacetone kinase subunit DhaK [Vibrio halioticoli]GAD87983.1 PTS-dependent dihydroxyacetone kinase dihydroxyacetone-binding subunit DhaK [Vibrio halioticoli NBRC 102217]
MKKIINNIEHIVLEQTKGLIASRPSLKMNNNPCYVWHESSPNQVALVSGGASGHEPLHTGFVGKGMITGACPGEIFTRATPDQAYECASQVKTEQGVLFFIKNYIGDIMNFELAVELLHADGVKVGSVLIDDDIAVKRSLYTTGRRGVTGTVLVEKIVGAAAAKGYTLEQCEELGRRVNNHCRTISVALKSCIVPAARQASFELADNEVEFGVGIHGEPGIERIEYHNANDLITRMFLALKEDNEYTRTLRTWDREEGKWNEIESSIDTFCEGDDYIAIVNGLGGTPVSELYIAYNQLWKCCQNSNYHIVRNMVGNYCTGLDMEGLSITLLKADPEMVELFDAPVDTAAIKW